MSGWLVALLCILSAVAGGVMLVLVLAWRFLKGFWRG